MSMHRGKRLTSGVTDHARKQLQQDAELVDSAPDRLVAQAALDPARRDVESDSTTVFTRQESLRLPDLLENPPPATPRFCRRRPVMPLAVVCHLF
ncbi:hypothetical protein GALL_492440 [mine drainage metagenome]|uniref:Uncharacterized protein n=1 Tax=mine drainage metagenome TaxID=410659 RepID=A0A1J5PCV0_9ZZZZ